MKNLNIFLYEWKHFIRSPFKIVALLLFVLASIYGLHNGANLYEKQKAEIEKINQKAQEQKAKIIAYYDKGQKSPEGRPWIDFTTPFWAIWNVPTYAFKTPSPAIVYSLGQAEQYGFYKQISVWASPYDADMAEEIANPERLQTGTLDFAFAVLFLLPLLLLILTYNLKSTETEQGFLSLIYVQTASKNAWLLSRMLFYVSLLLLVTFALIGYGAMLTNVLENATDAFVQMLFYTFLYLAFWAIIYFFVLQKGTSILGNTLQMVGFWLLFTLIIPAAVHQFVGITKPVNLMTDLIDVQRDGREKLFAQPDSVIDQQLFDLLPEIKNSKLANDSTERMRLRRFSASALVNQMVREVTDPITQENQSKNAIIRKTYLFNPLTFFQNQFNALAQTHYQDYETYRRDIQNLVDKRIGVMVSDLWNDAKVDKAKYLEYEKQLRK
jgi:ABC-2 type transport system permease protein